MKWPPILQTVSATTLPDLSQGKDECNLAEWPLCILGDRIPDGVTTLTFHDTITDSETRKPVARTIKIHGSGELGLPTAKDEEVLLGLMQLSKQDRFTNRTVYFSRHQLIHLLGWPDTGISYRRLHESLKRWKLVGIECQNAWWDNGAKGWVTTIINILDKVELYENEQPHRRSLDRQATLPFSSFTWGEDIFASFGNGYLKRFDLQCYLGLGNSTARRLYRFLDKRFYHTHRLEFDLRDFAFEHIGLSRQYHTGKIKEKLAPAMTELEAIGYLEPTPAVERYQRLPDGRWRVVLRKKAAASPVEEIDEEPIALPLVKALIDRGVTAKVAEELVATFPANRIERQLDVCEWMQTQKDADVQNPGGWVAAAIRNDYTPPKGYRPKAERERQAAAKAKREEGEQHQRQQQRSHVTRADAERQHVDACLAGMSDADRQDLESRAIAGGTEKEQDAIRQKSLGWGVVKQLLIHKKVLHLYPLPERRAPSQS